MKYNIEVITTCIQRSVRTVEADSEQEAIRIIEQGIKENPEDYDSDDVICYEHHVCDATAGAFPLNE